MYDLAHDAGGINNGLPYVDLFTATLINNNLTFIGVEVDGE